VRGIDIRRLLAFSCYHQDGEAPWLPYGLSGRMMVNRR
jgi:hypothetical protein